MQGQEKEPPLLGHEFTSAYANQQAWYKPFLMHVWHYQNIKKSVSVIIAVFLE